MRAGVALFIVLFGLLAPDNVYAQLILVTGKIIDKETGGSISQLSVVEKTSGFGTISNESGMFSLFLKAGSVTLNFRDDRYLNNPASFVLKSDTVIQVSLSAIRADHSKKGRKEHVRDAGQSEYAENPVPIDELLEPAENPKPEKK